MGISKKQVQRMCLAGIAVVAVGALWGPHAAMAEELRAGEGRTWYRGNMHTHSHWSDGDDYLESIGLWYRNEGYDFLVFTDHNVLADKERWVDIEKAKGGQKAYDKLKKNFPDWIEERTVEGRTEVRLRRFDEVVDKLAIPGEYLLIQGEEISDRFEKYPIHMNATHLRELIQPQGGNSVTEVMQRNLDAVAAQRKKTGQAMILHLNHPNFGYAVNVEDIIPLVGEKFFEVYNGHPGVHNSGDDKRASTERIWDIVLTKRLAEWKLPVMYGLATDDGHNYHNIPSRASEPGRGWVMVLAEELTPEALIESLEAGKFYSSSGVELARVTADEKGIEIEAAPREGETLTIEFVGTRAGYDPEGKPVLDDEGKELRTTRRYSESIGMVLERVEGPRARYEFQGDEIYVRARVTSSLDHPNPSELGEKQRAWTQPVLGKAVAVDGQGPRASR